MDVIQRQKSQTLLIDTLKHMSEKLYETAEVQSTLEILKSIYNDGCFRHSYSGFLPFLTEISEHSSYSIDYLAQNLSELNIYVETYPSELSIDTQKSIFKLCDHLNLEIARMTTFSSLSGKFLDANAKVSQIKKSVDEFENKLKTATNEAQNLKTEMLSILSIFAGIVMVFTGSFSLLGSAFENISFVSKYRLFFMTALLGLVLFNTIFMFIYVISRIVGRPISTRCSKFNSYECNCQIPCVSEKFGTLKKLRRKYPYVLYMNLVLLLIMLALFVLWLFRHII